MIIVDGNTCRVKIYSGTFLAGGLACVLVAVILWVTAKVSGKFNFKCKCCYQFIIKLKKWMEAVALYYF